MFSLLVLLEDAHLSSWLACSSARTMRRHPECLVKPHVSVRHGASGLPPYEKPPAAAYHTTIDNATHVGTVCNLGDMVLDVAGRIAQGRGKARELKDFGVYKEKNASEMTLFSKCLMHEEGSKLRGFEAGQSRTRRPLELERTKSERKKPVASAYMRRGRERIVRDQQLSSKARYISRKPSLGGRTSGRSCLRVTRS